MYRYIIISILSVGCSSIANNPKLNQDLNDSLNRERAEVLKIGSDSIEVLCLDLSTADLKLTSLEIVRESLDDRVDKIIVTDSYIYIKDQHDGGGLVIFDKMGRFVKRVAKGEKPGELYKLDDISYDIEEDRLVAYQNYYQLIFSPSGDFIKQELLPLGCLIMRQSQEDLL